MKRFRFKLNPILQQRKWLEEQCAAEYARAQQRERVERERLRQIDERYRRYLQALEQAKQDAFDVTRIQGYLCYLELVEQQRDQQRAVVEEAAAAREKAHARWLEANRDLKVVDTLREHAYERHQKAYRTEEQKRLDDIASLHHQAQDESLR